MGQFDLRDAFKAHRNTTTGMSQTQRFGFADSYSIEPLETESNRLLFRHYKYKGLSSVKSATGKRLPYMFSTSPSNTIIIPLIL